MIGVIIAATEPDACAEVAALLPQGVVLLSRCGTIAALQQALTQHVPHVVLTDIAFPDGDALELVRRAHAQGLPSRFIIITACTDFATAHRAIRCHVADYLLHPIDSSTLHDALHAAISEHAAASTSASRHQLLQEIRNPQYTPKSIPAINEAYDTIFREGFFRGLLLKLDDRSKTGSVSIFHNAEYYQTLATIVRGRLSALCFDILFDYMSDSVFALVNYGAEQRSDVRKAIDAIFIDMKNTFKDVQGIHITLCVSREHDDAAMLPEIKNEVLDARWARLTLGIGQIIHSEQLLPQMRYSPALATRMRHLYNQIAHACEVLDIDKCRQHVQAFFSLPPDALVTREGRVMTKGIITTLFDIYFSIISADDAARAVKHTFIYEMNMAASFDEIGSRFSTRMTEIINTIAEKVNTQYSKPVREAIAYIGRNCRRPITLDSVAREVGLAPTYFTSIFTRETGHRLSGYIAQTKMQLAKKLLQENVMNISEIAGETGYADVRYFSKVFKRYVEVTPTEYKKIAQLRSNGS